MQYDSSGSLIGGAIIIYDHQVDGNGHQTPCASVPNYSAVIAHELGHTLGLSDLYSIDPNNPGLCSGAIMSSDPEEIYPDECKVADSDFFTPAEDGGSQPPAGGGEPDGGCPYGPDGCVSPIVINLDHGSYRLTGANSDPVSFDINADGRPDLLGWTVAGANEAFLALDRNHNGVIDDGSELFGNYTILKNGMRAPNGFVALGELDDNHDGVVDAADSVWTSLRLWIDENHDGISQPEELLALDDAGITSLRFNAHWTGRHDQYGNVFRYQAIYTQGKTTKSYYDIFFVTQP